ncbi:hypothetical protein CAY60_020725 [Shouchella clausii]|uniref:hypothetical protein n=1 Tax=Shouchella TaxID=2893057 RepID=UPI0004E74AE3|nr:MULTISPECIES: hypothetical protein [Shouchella]NKR09440.1 hypothetical protein [Escherichia coli]ALA55235.1 hypothetical protein DB29_0P0023 [Shouchella clausii]MBU3266273.1 hypothetical protein [Shouchella clausii]MBU3509366.1 hypothetical protein [Shouchella clausii]MDP0462087.1 hypothetical protein [Shouchella rhizosphaerae]
MSMDKGMKRVSFSLFSGQGEAYKSLVDPSMQSRILRYYILNEYQLPKDLKIINQGEKKDLETQPFRFDEYTDRRLNVLVKEVRHAGHKANRSSLMRHVMTQLINKLEREEGMAKDREIKHSSFYFEKGTREVLDGFVPFRDRNAVIERFILEEFRPKVDNALFEKPVEPESMRISMSVQAFDKLDEYAEKYKEKGIKVKRTALMRQVVEQLIGKLSKTDGRKLIAEAKLQHALSEYAETFGHDKLKERIDQYGKEE